MKPFKVILHFTTDTGNRWVLHKKFNNERHLNNFVTYIMRTKGYFLDEVFNIE